jgi:class 3 adenylate cyclase
MNEKFKERFNEAIEGEIPDLLDILKSHYGQIPSHFKGSLNQLTNEFFNQPNNFTLSGWKSKFLVLIGQFKFEIQEDTPEPPPSDSTNSNTMKQATKTLYIIFADLKGYGSNAGNNPLLAKVTDFFISLQNKYFADGKAYFFKRIGDGILVTGYSLIDMAQKAIVLRNEIKNHDWQGANFLQALNVRMALHTGEVIEHYKGDGTIDDVSGTAVIQAARLEPYVMVGEVFCSQIYADLLTQHKTHNLATINLGKHNLGKAHDTFELDIAVLFAESDKEMYEEYKSEKCKKHLAEKIQSQNVEQSEVAKNYDKGNETFNSTSINQNKATAMDRKTLIKLLQEAYDAAGIDMLCYLNFEKVHGNIESLPNKDKKVIELIKHCEQHILIEYLLEIIKNERPAMHAKFVKK